MAQTLTGLVQAQQVTVHENEGDEELVLQNVFMNNAKITATGDITGDCVVTNGVVENILLSPYTDLDRVPNIKALVDKKVAEETAKQKFHIKFL